jgi:serine/threonine-protein kinase
MGEVYRARDTRLGRDVALKLLPSTLSADPDRLRRFEREAKTLAALNHPHIAQIYGIETMQDGGREIPAIAMEFVEGKTLERRRFEIPEALPIASQIADALEAAHDAGIVHRDLKPANIIVRDDGVVKVLDFGLAKSSSQESDGSDADALTVTSPAMTQAGMILGTAAYMSPEQAKGRVADRRADIWAFGVVLFEMLTGERLFAGATVTEVLAAVMKDPLRLDRLPPGISPSLRQLISRCLERNPKMRMRDIGEARIALTSIQAGDRSGPALEAESPGLKTRGSIGSGRRAVLGALAALALAGIAAYVAWQSKPSISVPVRRFDLPAAMAPASVFAISPDGSRIAYVAKGHLFVHTLATAATADIGAVPVPTEGLMWSPDGRRLAYSAESDLRITPADGGPSFTVCRISGSGRLTKGWWHDDGTIYFAVWRENLYRVPASGGPSSLVTAFAQETEIDAHSLAVLPDNRLIVTTHLRGQDAMRVDLVDGGKRTPLSDDPDIDIVRFRAPNELLFVRVRRNPGVWVVPFDGGRIDLTRATLLEAGADDFSVSSEGTLVSSVPARERRELVWVAHGSAPAGPGETTSTRSIATMPGAPFEPGLPSLALSADGRRAAFPVRAADGGEEYLVRDLATGRDTRVPPPKASTGVSTGGLIAWTPTGRLLYPAGGVESLQIYDWPADGTANGWPLVTGTAAKMPPGGAEIVFSRDERSRFRLYRAPIGPDSKAGDAVPVFPAASDPNVRYFDLSPDGTLLAFTDIEPVNNRLNIFVTTWPDMRERQQVTTEGGVWPRFSKDSRRVFYRSGGRATSAGVTRGELRVVAITTSPLSAGTSKLLMVDGEPGTPSLSSPFAVGDNDRLLMMRVAPMSPGDAARMVLLQNWPGLR